MIPLELEPFIGTNTPLGLALKRALAEGSSEPLGTGRRPARTQGNETPDAFGWCVFAASTGVVRCTVRWRVLRVACEVRDPRRGRGSWGARASDPRRLAARSRRFRSSRTQRTRQRRSRELVAPLTMQKKWNETRVLHARPQRPLPRVRAGGIVSTPTIARLAEKVPRDHRPHRRSAAASRAARRRWALRPASQDGSGAVVAAIESLERRVASSPSGNRYYSLVTENAAMVANELRMAEIEERHHDMGECCERAGRVR